MPGEAQEKHLLKLGKLTERLQGFFNMQILLHPDQPESSTGLNSGPWRLQVQDPGRAGIMGPDPAPHQ